MITKTPKHDLGSEVVDKIKQQTLADVSCIVRQLTVKADSSKPE
jgi:hypothetical protein